MVTAGKPIASLRWWIGALLFTPTVINYIDRQTLSPLAPYLKLDYHWTNSDYANIAIGFRVAGAGIGTTFFRPDSDYRGAGALRRHDSDLAADT
jgi:hypothetical protein